MKALFVAGDGGAREALGPAAQTLGGVLESFDECDPAAALALLRVRMREGVKLLVVGTSDSAAGRAVESAARRVAREAGVPIAAVEDFPGNYYEVDGGPVDAVIVESEGVRRIHRARGTSARVQVIPPARYDPWRERSAALRAATIERWAAQRGRAGVLWAGQPDTEDALRTLEVLIPALAGAEVALLFKAHPRDAGYARGDYAQVIGASPVAVRDCTPLATDEAFALAPSVLVTQFSSLALEAGFHGVPALCVLLPEAGGARLRAKKGYDTPPACSAGALAIARNPAGVRAAIERLLSDDACRKHALEAFDAYISVSQPAAPKLAQALLAIARSAQISP